MVKVGIAGLGPDWEARFLPALRKLRARIGVRALYDPVAGRAVQVAEECGAEAVEGLVALSERADVRALLLLEAGWHGFEAVRLLCQAGKPVLIGSGLVCDRAAIGSLHEAARLRGQTIVPAFAMRYTPASSRLRELLATRLGPPQSITIDAAPTDERSAVLLALLDWCRYVVGTPPLRVEAAPVTGSGGSPASTEQHSVVQIEFAAPGGSAGVVRVELRLKGRLADLPDCGGDVLQAAPPQVSVRSADGSASLESAAQIVWQNGGKSIRETLNSDRGEIEVMLDLFCRRVVGGLIPAPDLADVLHGIRLLEAARQSRESGQPVDLAD